MGSSFAIWNSCSEQPSMMSQSDFLKNAGRWGGSDGCHAALPRSGFVQYRFILDRKTELLNQLGCGPLRAYPNQTFVLEVWAGPNRRSAGDSFPHVAAAGSRPRSRRGVACMDNRVPN